GGAGSNPKSGGGSNEQESSSNSNSGSILGSSPATNVDTIEQQIVELMRRIDRLDEQSDKTSQARNEASGVHTGGQNELRELNRKVNELAALAERFRRHEQDFDKFREEFRVVRAQVDAIQGGPTGGRTAPGVAQRPGASGSSPPGSAEASISPAMKEGIE